jgi:hypothetical protein
MRRLRSTSLIVHAHKVVVRAGDRLGVEGEVLAAHQRLSVPHILRANHLTGHLREEIMELRAVYCWGEQRAFFLEKVHGSTAPLYRCLRYNNLGQEKTIRVFNCLQLEKRILASSSKQCAPNASITRIHKLDPYEEPSFCCNVEATISFYSK